MPPIVTKKGIAGHIYAVPIAQSQVLPFRSNDFMQHHTRNLDGIARIAKRTVSRMNNGRKGQKLIRFIDNTLPNGFFSKSVTDAVVRSDEIDNIKFNIDLDQIAKERFATFKQNGFLK